MEHTSLLLLFFVVVFVCIGIEGFFLPKVHHFSIPVGDDPGKPLFLTPFIEAGKIKKGQHLSKVKPNIGGFPSYSGYLTTNKDCGNNLFFWFFPAQENWKTCPVVLWLQGGPGSTSLFGLFEEVGPFNSFPDGLQARNYSWNVKNNLLVIDQPVGTGYSFTKQGCYVTNETAVAEDLYSAIVQFLKLFPDLQKNDFFITGESYAGHYIPAVSYKIYKNNPSADLKINLAGMMIGDGWMDPREQINYGDYAYEAGLIDDSQRSEFYYYQDMFVGQVDAENWDGAYNSWVTIITLFRNYTGLNIYNYLPHPPNKSNWDEFVQLTSTRKAIHVGPLEFDKASHNVSIYLRDDEPQSVKPWVEELLEHYPIVFYAGQLDFICAYPMIINFLRSLKWSGQAQYLNATRTQWIVDGEIAGFIKGEYHLYDVLVRDAGHMVPADQPSWAYDLVNSFTHSKVPGLGRQ